MKSLFDCKAPVERVKFLTILKRQRAEKESCFFGIKMLDQTFGKSFCEENVKQS